MSKSILRLSGPHWLRLTALWLSFVFLIAGIGEGVSAGAVASEPEPDKKPLKPMHASAATAHAAGAVTIDRIAAFDFNRQATDVFADADVDPVHTR